MPSPAPESIEERWDDHLAQWLIGKYVLVGVTKLKPHSTEVDRQFQIHGTVVAAEKGKSITVECSGARVGKTFQLPPDTAVFSPGAKQIYRLRSTGEEVDSPDALATWEIASGNEALEEFI